MLVISIIYDSKNEAQVWFFHVLYLQTMPFCMPGKLQIWIVPFLLLPNLGRVARPQTPIYQPSTPQNSTSAPLFRCPETPFLIPQTAFWDTPNGQMGVFYNTSCCHSYGCFTPLKRVFLPSHSVEIGHKTHVYAPV